MVPYKDWYKLWLVNHSLNDGWGRTALSAPLTKYIMEYEFYPSEILGMDTFLESRVFQTQQSHSTIPFASSWHSSANLYKNN